VKKLKQKIKNKNEKIKREKKNFPKNEPINQIKYKNVLAKR
jgi:hypothetical protein